MEGRLVHELRSVHGVRVDHEELEEPLLVARQRGQPTRCLRRAVLLAGRRLPLRGGPFLKLAPERQHELGEAGELRRRRS
ncbi:MAG: hypothetical protein ABR521_10170, partial [Gaiellaceae bacterium]